MTYYWNPIEEQAIKRIAVIINGSAGGGHDGRMADELRDKFAQAGCEAQLTVAADGAALLEAAARAVADGFELIVAGGGDGTINAVASKVAGSQAILGVLPLGTLNHFAKDLGMPLALDDAIATVVRGRVRAVDVAEVNGQIFLNNSSLGLYPDIVRDRERQQHRLGRGKWLAALWATVSALRRFPFLSLRLTVDGVRHARRTPFVFIGNNVYTMQGLAIGGRAALDAGVLSLYVAQRPGRLGLLRFALRALRGTLAQARDFDVLLTDSFEIDSRHRHMRVATDGEVTLMQPPLRYRVRPAALRVMAPAEPAAPDHPTLMTS